jgi:hypothetical protein
MEIGNMVKKSKRKQYEDAFNEMFKDGFKALRR